MSRISTTGKFKRLREAKSLDDTVPNLRLEDTAAQLVRGVRPTLLQPSRDAGANPYDTFPQVGKSDLHDRNAELRRLSARIRQKRAAEELKAMRANGEVEDED